MIRVPPILDVDYRVEVTRMEDINIIKDVSTSIMIYQAQLPTLLGTTHFERPFILTEPIERTSVIFDIYIGSQRVYPMTTIGGEGAAGTSAPVLVSISA